MAMLDTEGAIMKLNPSFRVGYIKSTSTSYSGSRSRAEDDHDSSDETAESNATDSLFARPSVLIRLAQFLQKIQNDNGSWTGKRALPLLLAAEKKTGWIVVGVSASGTSQVCFFLWFCALFKSL
jgi:hypothetical protein